MFRWLENEGRRFRPWILVGLTVLFVMVVRIRLREMPLERDEGEYAYAGQLILQGVPPYKEVYNMKLPGTYAAYAIIMAVFGQTPAGIHLGVMLVNVASIILMFLVGRKLLDDVAGVVAAVSYALLSLSPWVLGLAGHATHFVVLFALAGIFVLMKAVEDRGPALAHRLRPDKQKTEDGGQRTEDTSQGRRFNALTLHCSNTSTSLFLAGLLLGIAFLMKQHGVFFCLFGVMFLFWARFSEWWIWRSEQIALSRGRIPPRPRPVRARPVASAEPVPTAPRLNAIAMKRREEEDRRQKTEDRGQKIDDRGQRAEDRPQEGGQKTGLRSEASARQAGEGGQRTDDGEHRSNVLTIQRFNPSTPHHSSPTINQSNNPLIPQSPTLQPFSPSTLQPPLPPAGILKQLAILCCGIFVPYLVTCLVLLACGAFHQFVFWTITYAGQYVSVSEIQNVPQVFKSALELAVGMNTLLWILPWAGAFFMWTEPRLLPKYRFFLVALLLCSFGSISVGFYFREHYFITLLPALALLIGIGLSRGIRLLQGGPGIEMILAVALLVFFVAAIGASVIGSGNYWFGMSPTQAVRNTYFTSLFEDAIIAADYIRTNSPAHARIAVLGSEPEIPFYAHRRSVTGHIYMYPLMERHRFSERMQQDMISEIERGQAEYAVLVDQEYSWLRRPSSEHKLLDWWASWSITNMDLVNTLNIEEGREKREMESKQDLSVGIPEPAHLYIYRRRQQY